MTETLQIIVEFGAFAVCIWIVRSGVILFVVAWHLARGTHIKERTRLPDEPLPEQLTQIEAEIRSLGFILQRVTRYRLASRNSLVIWGYHHPELNIELELVPSPARPPFAVVMETHFTDGAMLLTWYPRGNSVEGPGLLSRFAEHSLHEAFDHHLLTQLRWTEEHGEAQPISDDDAEYAAAGQVFLKRHGRILYAPNIRQHVGQGIARFGIALLLLSFVFQLRTASPLALVLIDMSSLSLTTVMFLAALLLIVGGSGYSQRGKPPVAVDAGSVPKIDPKLHPLQRPERLV